MNLLQPTIQPLENRINPRVLASLKVASGLGWALIMFIRHAASLICYCQQWPDIRLAFLPKNSRCLEKNSARLKPKGIWFSAEKKQSFVFPVDSTKDDSTKWCSGICLVFVSECVCACACVVWVSACVRAACERGLSECVCACVVCERCVCTDLCVQVRVYGCVCVRVVNHDSLPCLQVHLAE